MQDNVEYPIVLGPSLETDSEASFTTLRYMFKPKSMDPTKTGYLRIQPSPSGSCSFLFIVLVTQIGLQSLYIRSFAKTDNGEGTVSLIMPSITNNEQSLMKLTGTLVVFFRGGRKLELKLLALRYEDCADDNEFVLVFDPTTKRFVNFIVLCCCVNVCAANRNTCIFSVSGWYSIGFIPASRG